uniref:Putative fibrillin n=1 Tax=Lutzomyia longipalpis TaxID=7200 RepID=A0A1B0CSV8_LUTLO
MVAPYLEDLNYCGTHEPCMHGGTCENTAPDQYRCTCAEGLSGLRCEIVEHPCATQPCKNGGTCTLRDPTKYDAAKNLSAIKDLVASPTAVTVRRMRGMSSMGKPARSRTIDKDHVRAPPMNLPAPPDFICTCAPGWTGPMCETNIDECEGGPCEHGGTCIDLVGGFRCECPPQWSGDLCQTDVDECESNPASPLGPCINAEACVNTPGAFRCFCLDGWTGTTCAKDIDDCIGQCKNGATCIDLVNDYYCACALGYTGRNCEMDIDECVNLPCRNGGECVDMVGTFKCICPVGYSGTLCEEAKDYCTPSPCLEGQCLNTPGGYYCHCPAGRSGRHCELPRVSCQNPPCHDIDECEGGPCEHGGTCIDLVGGFRCECPPQWSGDLCQTDVDECESNPASPLGPCINAEACVNTPGAFRCFCLDGWTGTTCAKDIDDCIGQCKNGATCIDLVNDYYCACALGYTGRNCEMDIDECVNLPCRNGGECVDMVGTFKCICPVGYSGTLCEEAKDYCTPSPCLEGQCLNTPGGYYCHCPAGRSGRHCELPRVSCQNPPCHDSGCTPPQLNGTDLSIPCSGNGQCETFMNGPFCVCQPGYTGHFCEHNLNECTPNPCSNGGICFDGVGDFTCECLPGWAGKTCSERITQCMPGQCLNGGTCVITLSNSQCLCASGWGGAFCTDPLDQCQGQPCHNGGNCESGPGWFRCVCATGFSGPDCRINVNECSPQPCLGGATCQDGIGGFTCICPPGRQGTRCEISILAKDNVLSDPASVCYNSSTLSPYNPLIISPIADGSVNGTRDAVDETKCNSCTCVNGKPKCTNIWCGLPNCSRSTKANASMSCSTHEVCVPALVETCLAPPCDARGDCRALEPSRRVAPPKLPTSTDCWPNQAILGEQCSRITILMDPKLIPRGTTVEGVCLRLRRHLADRLIKTPHLEATTAFIVVLCDIKTGSNDTIEVTLSSPPGGAAGSTAIKEAVKILGEILSRQGTNLSGATAEAASFVSIVEVKVETAMISSESSNSNYLVAVACGSAIAALCIGAIVTLMLKQRISGQSGSGVSLSAATDASRHEEEKSNNLQNEENFRRYANPLKGSSSSLRGAMELSLNPAPEIAPVSSIAGPSAHHRSQPLFPACDADFSEKDTDNPNGHRGSQNLLFKAQNPEVRNNTCTPNPCSNGGICFDGVGDFTCECLPGWAGKTCSERITQCMPGQCLNGGTCVITLSNSQCLCASGWGGAFCTDPLDQCQGQPCHNGGNCESGPGWFRCVCATGFSGPDCRINVNECSPQPCLGGATCQDGIGGFTCICPPGRQGTRCEISILAKDNENFRRYANPLKGSSSSLRGAMELSLNPAPEIAPVSSIAGPSAHHRSQPLFPACDADFSEKDTDNPNGHRGSQNLLFKAQNPEVRNNTVGTFDNSHKDFGKRAINCQATTNILPPDSDGLTVHV